MTPIETDADVAEGLRRLLDVDPSLKKFADLVGPLPLRRREPDLKGLVHIVVGQQVSVASAAAIFSRLEGLLDPFDLPALAAHPDEALAGAGLSRPKIRTLRAIARAVEDGLDLAGLASAEPLDAHARLCAIKGIGPWTADIYLLFCAGHPDIFPAGDIALQHAVGNVLALEERPDAKVTAEIAARWAPWRGIAARLFWAWYREMKKGRDVLPL